MLNRKILKNIFWLLAEHGTRMALSLIATAILARQLGVEQYGVFQYALSLVAIFISLSYICGSEVLVPMLTTSSMEYHQKILGNAFVVRFFFSVIAYLFLLLFAFLTEEPQVFYLIALLGITILYSESLGVVTAWLQSQTNSRPRSILVMASLVIKTGAMGSLYYFDFNSSIFYATAHIVASLIVAFGLLIFYYTKTNQMLFNYSFPVAYELFKKGLPFFGGMIAMFAFQRLDIVILKNFSDLYSLGQYAAATEMMRSVMALSPILVMSMAPIMVYKHNKFSKIRKNIILICMVMLMVSLLTSAIINLLAPSLVDLLFGSGYVETASILTVLVWTSCLIFLNEGLNIYLLKLGRGDLVSIKWVLAIMIALPVYWYCIPLYGAYGAVIGYGAGYLLTCLFGIWKLFSRRGDFS